MAREPDGKDAEAVQSEELEGSFGGDLWIVVKHFVRIGLLVVLAVYVAPAVTNWALGGEQRDLERLLSRAALPQCDIDVRRLDDRSLEIVARQEGGARVRLVIGRNDVRAPSPEAVDELRHRAAGVVPQPGNSDRASAFQLEVVSGAGGTRLIAYEARLCDEYIGEPRDSGDLTQAVCQVPIRQVRCGRPASRS